MEAFEIADPSLSWWSILNVSARCVLFLAMLLAAASTFLVVRARSAQGEPRQLLAALSVLLWFAMLAAHAYDGFGSPPGYLFAVIVVTICVVAAGQLLVALVASNTQKSGEAFSTTVIVLARRATGVTLAVLIAEGLMSGRILDEELSESEGIVFSLLGLFSDDASRALPGLLFLYAFFLTPYVFSRWFLLRAARRAGIVVPRYANWVPAGVVLLLLLALVFALLMSEQEDWNDALENTFGSYLSLGIAASVLSALSYDYFWDRSVGLVAYIRRKIRRSSLSAHSDM